LKVVFSRCDAHVPPTSGPFTGQAGNAEVIVRYNVPRGFSSIFGSGTLPVVSRAVARGTWKNIGYGILLLDPSSKSSLNATGNGQVAILGSSVVVDSADPAGATSTWCVGYR
jgi:hypothetical protein